MYSPSRPIDYMRKVIETSIYLVMVRAKQTQPDDPNVSVVTAKLRRSDAEIVKQQLPGSWIEKVVASKP